jgi:DNA (cytosine-5)-methyltransferase 1
MVPQAFGGNNQSGPINVATALNACASASGRMDFESESFVVAHSLRGEGFDASEDGTGRGTPIVAYDALGTPAAEVVKPADVHTPLRSRIPGQLENSTVTMIQQPGMAVRRLTPEECEALQAFPRGYTRIPWRGRTPDQCPDGPRYKALGNSWCTAVARWVGERIEQVESLEAA